MSRSGGVDLTWGDGQHTFRLAIGQLRDLEEKTKVGPFELFERLRLNRWKVDDLAHVLRVGLIGGGMSAPSAVDLVTRHIDEWPLVESAMVAQAVLLAALVGSEADPAGKGQAAEAVSAGASPASSETARPAASRRRKSTK
jgi:hypothetical protein